VRYIKGMVKYKKHTYNISTFTNEDAISYYILGAFVTDGNISKSSNTCSISSKDMNWLESINRHISADYLVKNKKTRYEKYKHWVISITNKEIHCWLNDHECVPCKSAILKMPHVPEQYFRDFLRGCIDGDGSIGLYLRRDRNKKYKKEKIKNQYKAYCYLCSISADFIKPISKKLDELGFGHCVTFTPVENIKSILDGRLIKANYGIYKLKFTGQDAGKFIKWLYYSDELLCLQRKYDTAKKWGASITHNYKCIYLGIHENEIDAAKSYDNKAKELLGEKAKLNFPI
jgi:hypothetical protein